MVSRQVVAVLLAMVWGAKSDCYTAASLDQTDFPRCEEIVENQLWVAWRLNDGTTIDIAIARKGLGWVGIGIAEEQSGGMKGADMLVVSKVAEVIVAEDLFAEGFWHPLKDDRQDVELLSTRESNGIFQAVVRRPVMTCDMQDQAIRLDYPHRLLYALGDENDWTFGYHGVNNRGNAQIYFGNSSVAWNVMYDGVLKDSSAEHMRIHFQNYHIPTADRPLYGGKFAEGTNQYKCLAVPLAQVTNLTAPFDIIGGTPIVTSKYLHHFVNSACINDPRPNPDLPWGQDLDNDIYDCAMGASSAANCMNIPGWAQGGSGFLAPVDSGVRIVEGTNWVVFDTHYYNPKMSEKAFDSSGYDYVITKGLRSHKLGTIWAGMDFTMRLPFGQKRAHFAQHCPAEALEHLFSEGQDTIQLLSLVHHLHQRGNGARTYVVRDGHRIPLVLQDYYDYNFQGSVPLNVTLQRGDALEVHCSYDTSADTSDIRWGERTQDEMCISITYFTPAPQKSEMFRCLSYGTDGPLGTSKFTTIIWDGMEKELQAKMSNFQPSQHPVSLAATGCVQPADTCPAFLWSICKQCALCFKSEMCLPSGCTTDKPEECEQCAACASCFQPSRGKCETCENTCEPYLTELPGYLFNATELHENIGYPIPDTKGNYDLPWGEPLSPIFSDYQCKVAGVSLAKKETATRRRSRKKASKKKTKTVGSKKGKKKAGKTTAKKQRKTKKRKSARSAP